MGEGGLRGGTGRLWRRRALPGGLRGVLAPVLLAAAAAQTKRIRLTSTVTVLSSADPVRVFEEFATLDLISVGRAEITAGRGAYLESFPLFGQPLERYDEYFEDRLELLLRSRDETPSPGTELPAPR
ncbi:LLM class flavin-dependent oxidoreductase [Arthrobacter sp. UYEF36]|uniref:LLM class flavin-dependent oxidoreductase n=1 Tax=Arthrobacter sp. UYEF36 TaxID=1756366 RepID=UPI0033921B7E